MHLPIKRFGNIVQHASSGFVMPEALARRIDELSRALPKDFGYRRLARKSEQFTLDPGERTDVSFITTHAADREGECVVPAGGDWSTYKPVGPFPPRYAQGPVR